MNDQRLQDWLRGKNGPRSTAETESLSAAERKELDRYDRIWEAATPPDFDFSVDTEAAWDRVDARLFGDEEEVHPLRGSGGRVVPFRTTLYRIAAAFLLLAVAGWWWSNQGAADPLLAYATAVGEREEIELPDGTRVWLNEDSEMTYAAVDGERSVKLTGEAFFDVFRDEAQPFVITTGELETRVLGTSFNVRAYADEPIEVAVTTGKVEVKDEDEAVVLTPSEAVTYEATTKKLAAPRKDEARAEAWVKQELRFDEPVALREMIPALERFYGRTFTVENEALLNCKLAADFYLNDLPATIELLSFQFEDAREVGNEVILRGKGCQ